MAETNEAMDAGTGIDPAREAEAAYWRRRTPADIRADYDPDEWIRLIPRVVGGQDNQADQGTSIPPATDGTGGR